MKFKKTIILGLTGGIGMGKSTIANLCRAIQIPVFDADRYIHRLLNKNGAGVSAVQIAFPTCYDRISQKINRRKLAEIIFKNPTARHKLEFILHPLVRAAEIRFITRHQRRGTHLIILDIPLLFETQADKLCTAVMVVSTPAALQRARILSRPNMTVERFKSIKSAQMPNVKRCRRADYILDTSGTLKDTALNLQQLLKQVYKDHV